MISYTTARPLPALPASAGLLAPKSDANSATGARVGFYLLKVVDGTRLRGFGCIVAAASWCRWCRDDGHQPSYELKIGPMLIYAIPWVLTRPSGSILNEYRGCGYCEDRGVRSPKTGMLHREGRDKDLTAWFQATLLRWRVPADRIRALPANMEVDHDFSVFRSDDLPNGTTSILD